MDYISNNYGRIRIQYSHCRTWQKVPDTTGSANPDFTINKGLIYMIHPELLEIKVITRNPGVYPYIEK